MVTDACMSIFNTQLVVSTKYGSIFFKFQYIINCSKISIYTTAWLHWCMSCSQIHKWKHRIANVYLSTIYIDIQFKITFNFQQHQIINIFSILGICTGHQLVMVYFYPKYKNFPVSEQSLSINVLFYLTEGSFDKMFLYDFRL